MHLLNTATAALAGLLTLAGVAAASSSDIEKKLELLNAGDQSKPLVLNSATYTTIVERPRNFSLFVMLTTSAPEHGCQPCKVFGEQYEQVIKAWGTMFSPGKLYFAQLDYVDASDIFARQNIQSVPMIQFFSPSSAPKSSKLDYELYDLQRHGMDGESLIRFVEQKTGIKASETNPSIAVRKPVDYSIYAKVALVTAASIGILVYFQKPIIDFLSNKAIWIALTIFTSLIMCSGYMWNTIRNPPFIGHHNGRSQYLSGGFQYQFGIETQTIAIFCKDISA
eukprot:jgi/Hompol1/186/HPOL_000788-RA